MFVERESEVVEQRDVAQSRVRDLEKQLSTIKGQQQEKEEELVAAVVREDQLGSRLISTAEALSSEPLPIILLRLLLLLCFL